MLRRPVTIGAIHARLTAAGFRALSDSRYERRHDRDDRYAVQVDVCLRGDIVSSVRVEAIRVNQERIFETSIAAGRWNAEALLDRMIERAREAYSACNGHRNGKTTTLAEER